MMTNNYTTGKRPVLMTYKSGRQQIDMVGKRNKRGTTGKKKGQKISSAQLEDIWRSYRVRTN